MIFSNHKNTFLNYKSAYRDLNFENPKTKPPSMTLLVELLSNNNKESLSKIMKLEGGYVIYTMYKVAWSKKGYKQQSLLKSYVND